jgi:hypothetical protein
VLPYSPILANEVLGLYAQVTWNWKTWWSILLCYE